MVWKKVGEDDDNVVEDDDGVVAEVARADGDGVADGW